MWAKIACLSFGGPAGQIALMHRILVEEKRWIGEERFLHALNYCMLLPGPEAQQLATYVGWLLHRTRGGIVAGALFVLPGLVTIMILSWVYVAFGDVGLVTGLFFGLKAAVLAIVLEAINRIGRRALRNRVMVAISAAAFAAIFLFNVPFPLIILAASIFGYLGARSGSAAFSGGGSHGPATGFVLADADSALGEGVPEHARPNLGWALRLSAVLLALWLVPVMGLLLTFGTGDVFADIAVFFSKMAVVTFGGAYAVLAYVAQQAVEHYRWLEPGEMLNGLGLAETTPGPLIMVTQFVGFLAAFRVPGSLNPYIAGTLGGLLTTWVTFVPCFLWIFLGAPFIERLRGNRALLGALSAITAAILNLAVWFGLHVLFAEVDEVQAGPLSLDIPQITTLDPAALVLFAISLLALFQWRVGVVPTLFGAAGLGALWQLV
ncbi:chromate transporter protein [Fulvimarina pelagi HTCC2506]|uniref:Chromate transporter protein n=1 Tax=Fulvimarina pelagi HTCC2506 TaxID=314231 RepID=Q0G369_9HYPH|nr:chromate transporter protein [Fulvimarina pelagi HTCC2506]